MKVCVIGAGCSGLTAVKNLIQAGIEDVVCYEQSNQIGGNWVYTPEVSHSSVCDTTHLISSKSMSEFIDFPMPDDYPDYPSHDLILKYFQSYAHHYGLMDYLKLSVKVEKVERTSSHRWRVHTSDNVYEDFDHLLVSNGHHSVPRHPDLPGFFSEEYLHSHSFKTNTPFRNKRVLVIGGGNSGCDCAVESSRVAAFTALSMRRPHYIVPKFFMGRPADSFNTRLLWLPKKIGDFVRRCSLMIQIGGYKKYNLPNPDFPITADHPTMNSELLYMIRHGKVHPRKGIQHIENKLVTFVDGISEEYDVIIAATGYKIATPFFDDNLINYSEADRIPLFLRIFHPQFRNLYFIGLVQPQGAIWPLSDLQSKLVANYIAGRVELPHDLETLAEKDSDEIESSFLKRKRHVIEVHYHQYVKKLKKWIPRNAPEWKETKVKENVERIS